MKPRILEYDLEVSRAVVEGYGNKWDFKVVKFIRQQQLMCYAYRWLGDKRIRFVSMHDFKTYHDFVQSLVDLQDEADIVIAHNANKFDNVMSNTFYLLEKMLPPSPYASIDTLQVARRVFKFPSNSLGDLGEFLNLGKKEVITYAELEDDFMNHPTPKIVALMSKYNRRDVELLEKIYLAMRPYMKNHPNVNAFNNKPDSCPKCGSYNYIMKGTRVTTTMSYQRYKCNDCGGWFRDRTADKFVDKPEFVNT